MSAENPLVLFMPSGRRGRFAKGTPVIDAARELGVYVESVCGGRGICGRCQVEIAEGKFAKHKIVSSADHLSDWSAKEARYSDKRGPLKPGRRLSCSATIEGDLVVDIPADMTQNTAVVRKAADTRVYDRDPAVRLLYVEVPEPDMHKPLGDLDRLYEALARDWNLPRPSIEPYLLPLIQKTLRTGGWTVTAAIAHDRDEETPRLVALYPGLKNEAYGIAVDIGSTTIALHLSSLLSGRTVASAGVPNPQIRFGEDLMSRVSYVMMNPEGREQMTRAVREAIDTLAGKVADESGIDRHDILDCVFVGNPVMHHLFLGIDPTELGGAPFALALSGALSLPATALDLDLNPGARAYVLPCIAGHVGADSAAATLAEGPHRQEEMMLLVDVGTNAEIVLGNSKRLVAASSPTGPAFEGAEISCGQRAAPGAIERVRIDPETLEPRFKIIGTEEWSDDPASTETSAATGVTGICGSGIIEIIAEMFLAGILTEDGVIRGELAAKSPRIVPEGRTFSYILHETAGRVIKIVQNDVRAIQLAKAALYAGVKLLMEKQDVTRIDRIALAGAFGSFIEPKYAMVLGLVPDCALEKSGSVGNSAGAGARMALLNRAYRREIEKTVREIEKIETALEPKFQEHFVAAMAFPNKKDAYPELSKVLKLPNREADGSLPHRRAAPSDETEFAAATSIEEARPRRRGGRAARR